jgi:hypothetical protein
LNNNFLAGLQHFGNELWAAVRFVPGVAVLRRLMGASGTAASALGASSAAHGPLEAGARLLGNPRVHGRLFLTRMRRLGSRVEFLMSFGVFLPVFSLVSFSVFFMPLGMLSGVALGVFG